MSMQYKTEADLNEALNKWFTPSRPAVWNYIGRGEDDIRFRDALHEPGLQIMVYGPTGVGKTSLVLSQLNELTLTHITFPFDAGINADSIFAKIMQSLGFERVVSKSSKESKTLSNESQLKGGIWNLVSFQGKIGGSKGNESISLKAPYHTDADADLVAKALAELNCVIFFDDIEKVSDDKTRQLLTHLAKKLSDITSVSNTKGKVIFAGISQEVERLIPLDPSLRDRLADQLLSPLEDVKIHEILEKGWSSTGFDYKKVNIVETADLCCGYPRYAHWLGKQAALTSFRNGRSEIVRSDIESAIRFVVEKFRDKFQTALDKATGHKKGKRLRERILYAMAQAEDHEVHFDEILERTSKLCGEALKKGQISGPLGELRTERRGAVLEQGRRIAYHRFSDLMMKPYLRMLLSEHSGERASEAF